MAFPDIPEFKVTDGYSVEVSLRTPEQIVEKIGTWFGEGEEPEGWREEASKKQAEVIADNLHCFRLELFNPDRTKVKRRDAPRFKPEEFDFQVKLLQGYISNSIRQWQKTGNPSVLEPSL